MRRSIILAGVLAGFAVLAGSCAGPRLFRTGGGVELEFTLAHNDRFQSKAKWQAYKNYLADKLWKMMGDFPVADGPLNEKSLTKLDRQGYTLEKIQFDSEPGEVVPACVLIPHGIQPPFPALVCLHAEGQSKADIIGEAGKDSGTPPGRIPFAKRLAEKGYLVVAMDMKGAGDRMVKDRYMGKPFDWDRASADEKRQIALAQLNQAALNELLHGRTWMGRTIWDIKRAIDYIGTRKDVARYKIGCMGESLGGAAAALAAVYDDRIRVVVSAGGVTTYEAMQREGIGGPVGLYLPGMLRYTDMPDFVSMVAPRHLLIAGGKKDLLHPAEAAQKTAEAARKVCQLYGYPDNVLLQLDDSALTLSERTFQDAWAWLEKWM